MSIAHFSITVRRNTQPQSATDVVHYLTREGAWKDKGTAVEHQTEEADVAYLTRQTKATKARNDFIEGNVRNLPPWAHEKATIFFQQAAEWERAGGRYAYVLQMSLPRSLTHTQQMALKDDFIEATMHDKPLLWVKHEPRAVDGLPNPHLHMMLSARTVDGIDRNAQQTFARYNADDPSQGGCSKDRFWNERGALRQLRIAFADMSNFHLERAGVSERIDPRRLCDQGIDRPSFGKASRGKILSRDGAYEQAQAHASWEQRKAYKDVGDVQAIPREAFILLVRQWTREYERGRELPRSTPEVVEAWHAKERQKREQEITRREAQVQTLQDALGGVQVPMGQLMAALAASHEDGPRGGGLRMSLYRKEEGYGR